MLTLPPELEFRPATNADCAAVADLIVGILGAYGLDADHTTTDRDMSDLEGFYHQSGGRFDVLVERHNGRIIGSVGLRPMDGGTVELRKMYLAAAYRRRGLGKFLLDHALAESKRLGFRRVFLETATVLREALNLYKHAGFQQCQATHACAKRCDMTMELFI